MHSPDLLLHTFRAFVFFPRIYPVARARVFERLHAVLSHGDRPMDLSYRPMDLKASSKRLTARAWWDLL